MAQSAEHQALIVIPGLVTIAEELTLVVLLQSVFGKVKVACGLSRKGLTAAGPP